MVESSSAAAAGSGIRLVDQNALRVNQVLVVSLVVVAFVVGLPVGGWIMAGLAISLAIGAVAPGKGPFQLIYRNVLLSTGLVEKRPKADDAAPHRFAQVVGAVVSGISAVLLIAGFEVAGWGLAWLVAILALVNLLFGFCAGCFMFLHLQRIRNVVAQS